MVRLDGPEFPTRMTLSQARDRLHHSGRYNGVCMPLVKPGFHIRAMKGTAMSNRPFPSYWMYKDNKGEWRWTYHASNGLAISVSSESYKRRADCERSIEIMRGSHSSPTWMPSDLVKAD